MRRCPDCDNGIVVVNSNRGLVQDPANIDGIECPTCGGDGEVPGAVLPFTGFTVELAVQGFIIGAPKAAKMFIAYEDAAETEYACLIDEALSAEAALEAWQESRC